MKEKKSTGIKEGLKKDTKIEPSKIEPSKKIKSQSANKIKTKIEFDIESSKKIKNQSVNKIKTKIENVKQNKFNVKQTVLNLKKEDFDIKQVDVDVEQVDIDVEQVDVDIKKAEISDKHGKVNVTKVEFDIEQVELYGKCRATYETMAENMGISVAEVERRMADESSEFCKAYKKGLSDCKLKISEQQLYWAFKGNATLLVSLGKQYLGEADKNEPTGATGQQLTEVFKEMFSASSKSSGA